MPITIANNDDGIPKINISFDSVEEYIYLYKQKWLLINKINHTRRIINTISYETIYKCSKNKEIYDIKKIKLLCNLMAII